jgi:nitroreductase
MELLEAIYQRRSVRHYTDVPVPPATINDLIKAAVQAPSAMNQQPWAFAVIRGRARLDGYSERAKAHLLSILPQDLSLHERAGTLASFEYNIFHGASTLVIICAKPMPHHPAEDCCFAAQNFMLAAHGLGLGTCPIGFARRWLNLPEIKAEIGIPDNYTIVMPIVVGWPAKKTAAPDRLAPEIACWHRAPDEPPGTR